MKSETVAEVAKRIAQRRPQSLARAEAWLADRPHNHPARELQALRGTAHHALVGGTMHLQQHTARVASLPELQVTIADLEMLRDQVAEALRRARITAHYAPDGEV